MATLVFRDSKYDTKVLEKVSSEGHYVNVEKHLIVHEHNGIKDKPPVAIKVDSMYHLLQGTVDLKHNQPSILCITKFILKKCKIEPVVKVSKLTAAQEHQAKWNTPAYTEKRPSRDYNDNPYRGNGNDSDYSNIRY